MFLLSNSIRFLRNNQLFFRSLTSALHLSTLYRSKNLRNGYPSHLRYFLNIYGMISPQNFG